MSEADEFATVTDAEELAREMKRYYWPNTMPPKLALPEKGKMARAWVASCAAPNCKTVQGSVKVLKADALRAFASSGWKQAYDGSFYCPEHQPPEAPERVREPYPEVRPEDRERVSALKEARQKSPGRYMIHGRDDEVIALYKQLEDRFGFYRRSVQFKPKGPRNLEMFRAFSEGASIEEVAEAHGLSGTRVRQIIEKAYRYIGYGSDRLRGSKDNKLFDRE